MALTLTIATTNSAFDGDSLEPELARMLRTVADAIERGTSGAPLFDVNGNNVGRFDYEPHDDED